MTFWIQTGGGLAFDLEHPSATDVLFPEIIYSLSGLNRYTAHTRPWISVAEHSVRVLALVQMPDTQALDRLRGLLGVEGEAGAKEVLRFLQQCVLVHDFHEAYMGDISSPVLRLVAKETNVLKRLAADLDFAITQKLGLRYFFDEDVQAAIRRADLLALEIERLACLGPSPRPPGDGWPVIDAADRAWAQATWADACVGRGPSGLDVYTGRTFGWTPETSRNALTYVFKNLFPGALAPVAAT